MTEWAPGHTKPLDEDFIAKDTSGNYGVYGVTRDGRLVNHGPYLPLLELDSEDVEQLTKDSPFNFKSYEWEDIVRNRVLNDPRYVVGKAEAARPLWYPALPPPAGKLLWVPPLAFAWGFVFGTIRGLYDVLFQWDSMPFYKIPFVNKTIETSRKWTYVRACWRIYPRKMFLLSFKFMFFVAVGETVTGDPELAYVFPFIGLASFAGFPKQSFTKLFSSVTVAAGAGFGFVYARRLMMHAEPRITDSSTWRTPHMKYPYPPATDVLDRHVLGRLAAEKLNRNLDNYVDYKHIPSDPTKLPVVQRIN